MEMRREELIRHQFDGLTAGIYDQEYLIPTVFLMKLMIMAVKHNTA